MTLYEYKKINIALKDVYAEIEKRAQDENISLSSPEYERMSEKAKEAVLKRMGFTLKDYQTYEEKIGSFSKKNLNEMSEEKMGQFLKDSISQTLEDISVRLKKIETTSLTKEQVQQIAKGVAVPGKIQKIVETKLTDEWPLQEKISAISKKINELKGFKSIDKDKLKEELRGEFKNVFGAEFEKNINTLGMPNFRKLAMGLQAQIDDILADPAGSGTVTSVSVVSANGLAGTVATATTTPAITLSTSITGTLQGDGTAISASKVTLTQPATGSTLTIVDGKTLTENKTMSFTAADDTGVYTFPTGTKTLLATDGAGTSLTGIPYTITGTANQVVASADTGNITLSLPQSIATSSNPQFATVELGAASDTTISRAAAGQIAVEGVNVVTTSSTDTLTNKTIGAGALTLAENASIALDPAGSADGKYSGITIAGTAGAALAFGDSIYLAVADSRWELTDADAAATAGTPLVGMCVLAAAADGDPTTILLYGVIRADAKFPALTVGAPVYIGETAGAIQVAIPTGADNVIRIMGRALTADEIFLNPSQDHQVTVA